MTKTEALNQIARAAVSVEAETGLPAELIAAQCILESGWLRSAPGNNPFGIKARKGLPRERTQLLRTKEYVNGNAVITQALFERFDSLEDAFRRHAELLTTGKPYRNAWAQYRVESNLDALIDAIAPVYATDPHYSGLLRSVLNQAVRGAIEKARQERLPRTLQA